MASVRYIRILIFDEKISVKQHISESFITERLKILLLLANVNDPQDFPREPTFPSPSVSCFFGASIVVMG